MEREEMLAKIEDLDESITVIAIQDSDGNIINVLTSLEEVKQYGIRQPTHISVKNVRNRLVAFKNYQD